jgi:hypothetical protein
MEKGRLIALCRWLLGAGLAGLAVVLVLRAVRAPAWSLPVATIKPPSSTPDPAEAAPIDGACPTGFPVKGNIRTRNGDTDRIYHMPGSLYHERTIPEVCFASEAAALAAGFRAPRQG